MIRRGATIGPELPAAFVSAVAAAGLPPVPTRVEIVRADEVAAFAEPIRRYFRFMGVVGRPRVWSFRCRWTGNFRRAPDAAFRPCEIWQYSTSVEVARLARLRIGLLPLVPMIALDSYVRGHGRMLGKLFDRFRVVDAAGPELDTGELVTWLNDAVLLAPSMLLGPQTRWEAVDEQRFDVALTDRGRTVRARVSVDERGAPIDFRTTDRFVEDPADPRHGWRQTEWRTPIDGWTVVNGRGLPERGQAIWQLPAGPFTYVKLALVASSVAFNVQPDQRLGPNGSTR